MADAEPLVPGASRLERIARALAGATVPGTHPDLAEAGTKHRRSS